MTTIDLEQLENKVLGWIKEATDPVSTTDLLETHPEEANLSGENLRRVVWNLVDRGLVHYDLSWRLSGTDSAR
ncbi:MAG: hypothetical protein JWN53_1260 [Gemmatimonadetes bacterium]|jgi:hypothetical protein|nr:hypothetical protein [Gemmatimonadota bacterium]